MEHVYLSKRNLLTLLSKLERLEKGEETFCAIIKYQNLQDPYCNSMDQVVVAAIPDEKFYVNRTPGPVDSLDEPKL